MKYKWLNRKNNKELIVFFNGWGMDESVVSHLEVENFDIIMFYDYNNLNTDFDFSLIEKYSSAYLVAWSMGVMTATLFDMNYKTKTAINGTLEPINDRYGIPLRIYDLTLRGLSPKGVQRFVKSMFNEDCVLPEITRDFEEQKSELSALKEYSANKDCKFDRVIISTEDKIIPTKNQTVFWGIEPNIESGHAPFYKFKKWSELL
jgi:biotin synthesis protein BioG